MRQETYDTHALWPVLDEMKDLLTRDLAPTDDDARYAIRRLDSLVTFIDALKDADPVLVEQPPLDELHTHVTNMKQALTQYLDDTSATQYLMAAASPVPNALATCRQHFPWGPPDEAQRAVKAAATRYKNSLDTEAERLRDEVDALQEALAEAKQQREADASAAQEALRLLEAQVDSRTQSLDALQTKFEAQVQAAKSAFEEEAASRQESFEEAEVARVDAEEKRIEELNDLASTQRDEQHQAAQEVIAELENYRIQAKALTDETARHAVAGEYGTWAAHQASAAFWWTVATVVVGLATVGGLIAALRSTEDDSIQHVVAKLSISLVGLFVAAYTAHQAAEHRREERTAKRLALDLAALQPFLEQIQDLAELEKLRVAVANRVFVPDESSDNSPEGRVRLGRGDSISIGGLLELLRTISGQGGGTK